MISIRNIFMRVRFVLRKSRVNSSGNCPIDCRVRVNSIQATPFSTHIFVSPDRWDSKGQRIKGTSEKVKDYNLRLGSMAHNLDHLFKLNEAKGVLLSAQELVDVFLGRKEIGCSFLRLCEKKIVDLISMKRSESTIQIHRKCHNILLEFLGSNLDVSQIEKRHVADFWNFVKNKGISKLRPTGYDHDYVNKTVVNCKSLFRFAVRKGIMDRNPFESMSLQWEDKLNFTSLDKWEMEALKTTKWSDKLQKVVDSFLFMCYQGLHISDYKKLTSGDITDHLGVKWIKTNRKKTKVEVTVPLHSEAKKVIEKYGDISKLPKISGQKSNEYLQIIAEKIGSEKHFTNKVARKTFTDMCINEYHMSDESVAAMLGHKSTKYVRKYGTVKQNRILAEWKDRVA